MLENLPPGLRERVADRLRAELARRRREAANKGELEKSLVKFHRAAWPSFDPAIYVHNWHIDALADHLMAVMHGHIRTLIITQPPRTMKSSMTSASFPAFVWAQPKPSALCGAHVKLIGIAYDPDLSIRDATKSRRIIDSPWYQDRWGDRFKIRRDLDRADNYENTAGGFRMSTSIGGKLTGEGGDIIIVDDPINAKKANWESARQTVNEFWDETLPTRLNDQRTGAFIIEMQRLHEDDLVGHILDKADADDVVHLNLPMEFDPALDTRTYVNGRLFFEDPREEPEELLLPERFPRGVVDALKVSLGPFAAASQLQQAPSPRGGGIIDRMWWQTWPAPGFEPDRFPPCSLIIASLDTAYGEKEENAFNALTVWGIFEDHRERTGVVMMEAWRGRWPLRGMIPEECKTDDERKPYWGLAEKVADTIRRRNIDILLVENKTRGGDLVAEVRRLLRGVECQLILLDPEGNKVARLHAVQPAFSDGRVFAPEKAWAETVITEVSQFPKSKFADYTDTVSQALAWLRKQGILLLGVEADQENLEAATFRSKPQPRYDV